MCALCICVYSFNLYEVLYTEGCLMFSGLPHSELDVSNLHECCDVFVCIYCLSYVLYAVCLPHAVFLLVSAYIVCVLACTI